MSLRSLALGLRRRGLGVGRIEAVRDGLDVVLVTAPDRRLAVDLRAPNGGPAYAATRRYAVRYRGERALDPSESALLDLLVDEIRRVEGRFPEAWPDGASIGGKPARDSRLHRRFPFMRTERSGAAARVSTEVLVRVTPRCNQICPFCSAPPADGAPSHETVLACLRAIASELPGARVTLTGGEPTLRGRFLDEVRHALALAPIAFVTVQTNAVWFAAPRRARALEPNPRLGFFVSLHAVDEAIYDRCTATRGQLRPALAGIRGLLGAGHPVTLNAVASSLNLAHLPDLVAGVARLFPGPSRPALHFSILMCPPWRPGAADLLVPYGDLAPVLEAAAALAARLGLATEPLASSGHASIPLCFLSAEQRAAAKHRPHLGPAETGYEDEPPRRVWLKAAACRACVATAYCLGVPSPYARRWGLCELKPLLLLRAS